LKDTRLAEYPFNRQILDQLCPRYPLSVMVPATLTKGDHIPIRSEYLNHSSSKMAATGNIGNHPAIQPTDDRNQKIEHRAKYKSICCDTCDGMISRKYFTVYDNAVEWNRPYNYALCCCRPSFGVRGYEEIPNCSIFVLPPNCCCIGYDEITKMVRILANRINFTIIFNNSEALA
jgi:hypothetical protein